MNQVVVVMNVLTPKGVLIADYLTRNGLTVYGVDRRDHDPKLNVGRFFKMDIKHKESLELLMKIASPTMVIYCWDGGINSLTADQSLFGYWRLLIYMLGQNIENLIVCIDKNIDGPFEPISIDDFSQSTLYFLTNIFAREYGLKATVLSDKDNLLKMIKQTLILGGGEGS